MIKTIILISVLSVLCAGCVSDNNAETNTDTSYQPAVIKFTGFQDEAYIWENWMIKK